MTKVTIYDIACAVGVSSSTVSRSLRGLSGVSTSTAEQVKKVAQDLGYSPSPAAHRLATGRAGSVVIVTPDVTSWYSEDVLAGIEPVVRGAGLDLLLSRVSDPGTRRDYFCSGALSGRVDGVVLVRLALSPPEVLALQKLDVSVCVVGGQVDGFSGIDGDEMGGTSMAVRHLLNLGHRRFGVIASTADEPAGLTLPRLRQAGYHAALGEAGLRLEPEMEISAEGTIAGGESAAAQLLGRPGPPTAVLVETDEMAFGVVRAFRRVGLRVPEDISVIGFDGHPMAHYLGLTTVCQDVQDQGRRIAEHLVSSVSRPGGEPAVHMVGAVTLVVRSTTSVRAEGFTSAVPPSPQDKGPAGAGTWLEPVGAGQER